MLCNTKKFYKLVSRVLYSFVKNSRLKMFKLRITGHFPGLRLCLCTQAPINTGTNCDMSHYVIWSAVAIILTTSSSSFRTVQTVYLRNQTIRKNGLGMFRKRVAVAASEKCENVSELQGGSTQRQRRPISDKSDAHSLRCDLVVEWVLICDSIAVVSRGILMTKNKSKGDFLLH